MKIRLALAFAAAAFFATPDKGYAEVPVEKLYGAYCVQCHGLKRNGSGVNLPGLSTKPRDHTDTKGMGDTPDEELFKAIKEGGLAVNKSALMPAWGGVLTDAEITELVKYLRAVCRCGH